MTFLKTDARQTGANEEGKAFDYLSGLGWKLLARNYSTPLGEIDLIFQQPDKTIVFVEVKFRNSAGFGGPAAAVNRGKQSRIIKTAIQYVKQNRFESLPLRFDVVASSAGKIEHIPHAFDAAGYTL